MPWISILPKTGINIYVVHSFKEKARTFFTGRHSPLTLHTVIGALCSPSSEASGGTGLNSQKVSRSERSISCNTWVTFNFLCELQRPLKVHVFVKQAWELRVFSSYGCRKYTALEQLLAAFFLLTR